MTDLETRIRTWTDAATDGVAPVTVDELRTTGPGGLRGKRGLIVAGLVAVIATAAVLLSSLDDDRVVTDQGPTSASSSQTTPPGRSDDDYDLTTLLADLGPDVTTTTVSTHPGPPNVLDTTPVTLCVAEHLLRVYEYATVDDRLTRSEGISRDGSEVPAGPGTAVVEWIAPPHFYARGRLIVLYLGPQDEITTRLDSVLGPTLSPDAPHGRGGTFESETC